jgi:NitT/TauT family transport system permease protein
MTIEHGEKIGVFARTAPVLVVSFAIIAIWYVGAVFLNAPIQKDKYERAKLSDWTIGQLVSDTLAQDRPILPAPHQVAVEIYKTTVLQNITSKRSLIYHSWITLSSTILGFLIGTFLGIFLAILIVHNKALDKSLMPWIISSQTIPILAVAPMIIVVLAAIGVKGLLPKAIISTYLCFFPVAVGMVKGLRSPDVMHLDLMRTWSASPVQTFWKLRWPSSLPFFF